MLSLASYFKKVGIREVFRKLLHLQIIHILPFRKHMLAGILKESRQKKEKDTHCNRAVDKLQTWYAFSIRS